MAIPAQSGIALPTTLILLLVLTLLAAGALETARLELRTASSLREYRHAFELAEAATARALQALAGSVVDAPACGDGPGLTLFEQDAAEGAQRAWLCFAGSTMALPGQHSLGRLTLWHYEILAEGRSGRARSLHRQGAWLGAPASEMTP